MKLYHFTDIANLKSNGTILKDGLLIPPDREGFYVAGIWLTANPEPACWWVGKTFEDQCRITVDIPKTHRLRRCEMHLRCCPPIYHVMAKTSAETGLHWEEWYFFFGNIPLKRFRAVEHADPIKRAAAA